jgi:glycerol transport system ATP-binding protein
VGAYRIGGKMGIKVENIGKTYGRKIVLNDLSMEVPSQSFTTLLAPTGSGKTTLLRIMAGIEKPDRGRVLYDGIDVTDMPVQKRSISMVYQQFINYPSLTVYENVASPLRISKERYSALQIDERVQEVAKLLKIGHVLDHLPEELSGGEKQRTAIARALIKGSDFIFLDEPLANLDYKLREELRGELKTVMKGTTIVYATPEPIDALSMSSHIGYLNKGKIVQFGTVHEVYTTPLFVDVGHYFNDPPMNMMEGRLVKEGGKPFISLTGDLKIETSGLEKHLAEHKTYIVGVRPQDLSIMQDRVGMVSFEAEIDFTEIVGSSTTLHLVHGDLNLGLVVHQPEKSHRRGDTITVYLDPQRVYIYEKDSEKLVIAQGEAVPE